MSSDRAQNPEAAHAAAADPAAQAAAHDGNATVKPQDALAQAQRERDDYLEQLQRSRAEFANFQKRVKSQADADRVYAVGNLAKDLLGGLDNLERATEALRGSAAAGIVDGLDMVRKELVAALGKYGVEPIEALGRPFDPNQHEALLRQPAADQPEMTVVAELNKGYKIHDRVLRPSQVAVSVKPAES